MKDHPAYFKLGLFVILAFGLTAAFLVVFGAGKYFKKELVAETCFNESVQGLDVGSEVKYKGVRIGTVKSISNPAQIYDVASHYVLVTFTISDHCYLGQTGADSQERLLKALAQGLEIQLSSKGITGGAYLETDYYPNDKTQPIINWTPKNVYIPSRKSDIREFGDVVGQALDDFSQVDLHETLTHVTELLADLHQKSQDLDLKGIGQNANALLKEVRQTNAKLSQTLDSPDFKGLITDAHGTVKGLRTMVEENQAPLARTLENLDQTTRATRNITADLEKSLAGRVDATLLQLEKTIQMLEALVWTNGEPLTRTIENFNQTSENLKQLSRELKLYPGRIFDQAPPSPLPGKEADK
ncbi:MAG: MlaD family protein [Desulfobacterales bacterium]|nr:MlaD family protein [Desulfobacterales bacterium]